MNRKLDLIGKSVAEIKRDLSETKRLTESGIDATTEGVNNLLTPPDLPVPEPITEIRATGERKDEASGMWILTYEAKLPPVENTPQNKDVEEQKITVMVDGEEFQTQTVPRMADVVTFEVPKGKKVRLERSYIDDDENEGPPTASQEFVARDTIPPGAPGDFGEILNLGEREVPDEE